MRDPIEPSSIVSTFTVHVCMSLKCDTLNNTFSSLIGVMNLTYLSVSRSSLYSENKSCLFPWWNVSLAYSFFSLFSTVDSYSA